MLRNSLCAGATQLAPLWLFLIVSESFTGGASTMAVELEQSAAFLEPILGAHQQACVVSSRSSVAPAVALRTARAPAGGLRKWGRRRPQMKYHLSPPPSTHRRCAAAGIELEAATPLVIFDIVQLIICF